MIVMTSVPQQSSTSAHVTEFHCRWFARWRFVLNAPVNQWLPVSDGDLSGPVDVLAVCPLLINAIVPKVLTSATDLDCIFASAANFTFPFPCLCPNAHQSSAYISISTHEWEYKSFRSGERASLLDTMLCLVVFGQPEV